MAACEMPESPRCWGFMSRSNRSIRERIQQRFRAASAGAFDLLREIGRDCVGALQLLAEDDAPENVRKITTKRLTNNGVAKILAGSLIRHSAGSIRQTTRSAFHWPAPRKKLRC